MNSEMYLTMNKAESILLLLHPQKMGSVTGNRLFSKLAGRQCPAYDTVEMLLSVRGWRLGMASSHDSIPLSTCVGVFSLLPPAGLQ